VQACLGVDTLAAYATRSMEATEIGRLDAHVADCRDCRRKLSDLARVQSSGVVATEATGSCRLLRFHAPGEAIGRYIVEELLGAGGMGVVYAAIDPQLHRRVALKVVREDLSATPVLQERLLREAQAMAKLSHPNVVAVYDVVVADGRLYVAMEIVDGVSLKAWLAEERRSWRLVLHRFVEAGRGLAAAHAVGLVHRDFKPANVLCSARAPGRVCVTDFGLARDVLRSVTADCHDVEGTPAYMSPEQHRGERADGRSDQFSFCISLYEALFGRRPFAGTTAQELAAAKTNGRMQPAPPLDVPSRVRGALARGLDPDPARRHPSMESLLAALSTRTTPDSASRRRLLVTRARGRRLCG
jgi:serine/threonine protein kinase